MPPDMTVVPMTTVLADSTSHPELKTAVSMISPPGNTYVVAFGCPFPAVSPLKTWPEDTCHPAPPLIWPTQTF
jgi:hypothetical protein